MHEIQVAALNYIKQKKTIQQLMRQNRHLKRRIEILHTQWSKRVIKLNKTMMCLIVNVILSAQINMLIDEELLFQNKLKHYEFYYRNCCLTQCFKYQKYKHIIQVCCQNQKYNLCAISEHNDYNYVFWNELNKYCCTNCEKSYSAWFFKYKTRQKQIEKIWLIYSIKSCRYAEASTMSIKLNKNIWKSFFQMLLN